MINFIIYEDNKEFIKKYISVIIKMMEKQTTEYKIHEICEYNEKIKNLIHTNCKKIYILDIEVPKKSGLDLAREIRDSGDWNSQIIMVTTHDQLQQLAFTSRLLTLDFISKFDNVQVKLKKALVSSYTIITHDKALKIEHNNEFKKYFYNDIVYIKKNPEDSDLEVLLSDGSTDSIPYSMTQVEEELKDDLRFFRTHRSCIVNTTKIKSVDFQSGNIIFSNSQVDLLSRENKKKFKDFLLDNCIEYKEL